MVTKEEQSKIGRSNVRRSKSHERRIANLLSKWSGVEFRRRRVEGRENAVRIVERTADVIPCVGDFHFTVEAKCGKGFSFDNLMDRPHTSLFSEWWHQCTYDAMLVSRDFKRTIYPMVFFKPHPNWDWVAISAYAINVLRPAKPIEFALPVESLWFPHIRFNAFAWLGEIEHNISHSKKNVKLFPLRLDPVIFCRWHDFAANVSPESAFFEFPEQEIPDGMRMRPIEIGDKSSQIIGGDNQTKATEATNRDQQASPG